MYAFLSILIRTIIMTIKFIVIYYKSINYVWMVDF